MADDNSHPDPKTPPGPEPVPPPVEEPAAASTTPPARVEETDPYAYGEDPYAYEQYSPAPPDPVVAPTPTLPAAPDPIPAKPNPVIIPGPPPKIAGAPPKPPTPPKPPKKEEEDDPDEEGMARMSFVEHLEELRARLIRSLIGFGLSFLGCMFFAPDIWRMVSEPALSALRHLGANPPVLIAITPMEQFNTIWIKSPIIVSIFVSSPIILYQIWAFISPGLYKRERRWAIPFIVCTSGLFIAGGLFAYFIVFRFGLEFLLGIGRDIGVQPLVTISEYFDLFVNVMLGVGLVFELPVLIFFLALLRIASPRFLIQHSRYAILAIVIVAAVVTPTPDVFNLMLFAVPMIALYFVGVFAAYLLQLRREGKRFPWGILALVLLGVLLLIAGGVAVMVLRYHFKLLYHWPFLTK